MSAHMNNEHSFELYKNTNEKVYDEKTMNKNSLTFSVSLPIVLAM